MRSPRGDGTSPGGPSGSCVANYPPDLSFTSISSNFLRGIMRAAGGPLGIGHSSPAAEMTRSPAVQRIKGAYENHIKALIRQLLLREDLSLSWTETVFTLAERVARIVKPDMSNRGDLMDARHYVVIKKIPGARKGDSFIVEGVVCSKNIVHRQMKNQLNHAQILLFIHSIEYHRSTRSHRGVHSMEPVLLQEREYLRNCVSKLTANRDPQRGLVLLVQNTVSRLAQDFLLEAGVTLVTNVKQSVMNRIERSTRAKPVNSIEELVTPPILGYAGNFHVRPFTLPSGKSKTLMFFDGCDGALGCSVCLRGGSYEELAKIKKILNFAIFLSKNGLSEISYYLDELGLPPPLRDAVDNDEEEEEAIVDEKELSESGLIWGPKRTKKLTCDSVDTLIFDGEDQSEEDATEKEKLENLSEAGDSRDEVSQVRIVEERLKMLLSNYVVSSSPFLLLNPPYLLTEKGKLCPLKKYYPDVTYHSPLLESDPSDTLFRLRSHSASAAMMGGISGGDAEDCADQRRLQPSVKPSLIQESPSVVIKPPHSFLQQKVSHLV